MAYLNYTTKTTDTTDDLINLGLNEYGLIIDGQKITAGAPDTTSAKYISACLIQNIADGNVYKNVGTTSSPVWVNLGSGGGGTPSLPLNSIQYNNGGSFFGDSLATRDPVTNETLISMDQNGGLDNAALALATNILGVPGTDGIAMRRADIAGTEGDGVLGIIDGTPLGAPSRFVIFGNSTDNVTGDIAQIVLLPTFSSLGTSNATNESASVSFNGGNQANFGVDNSDGGGNDIAAIQADLNGGAGAQYIRGEYRDGTNNYGWALDNGGFLLDFDNFSGNAGTYYYFPTADGTAGQVLTTDGAGNLDFAYAGTGDIGALNVRVATTAVLPGAPTYNNGVAGVGATLTRSSNGTLGTIDGITPFSIGDRILVKNQASTLENGVYEVTTVGSAGVPYVITRTTDADTTAALDDMVVIASLGSTNKGIPFGQQTNNPTIGVSAIVFTQTSIYIKQQTSGTQAVNQIPVYTATARTLTKGTSSFTYNPTTNLLSIGGVVRSSDLHNNALAQGNATQQDIRSGTYTPTGTVGTNVTSVTPSAAQWMRVGNVVTVSGHVLVNVTAAATCDWELSIPVNSTWGSSGNLAGTASRATGGTVDSLCFLQSTTNNRAQFLANTIASGIHVFSYQYTYVVI